MASADEHPPISAAPTLSRIFLVEDDPAITHMFATFFVRMPGVAYLGSAQTLEAGALAVRHNPPDLVLLDMNMPDGNGLDYIAKFRASAPLARLAACTARDDPAFVHQAMRLRGGIDLIHKHDVATAQRLAFVLETMQQQVRFISPRIAHVSETLQDSRSYTKKLSDRQFMLLPYFGRNLSDADIARRFNLSEETVHHHRKNILGTLDLRTTADLVTWCLRQGFTDRRLLEFELPSHHE